MDVLGQIFTFNERAFSLILGRPQLFDSFNSYSVGLADCLANAFVIGALKSKFLLTHQKVAIVILNSLYFPLTLFGLIKNRNEFGLDAVPFPEYTIELIHYQLEPLF